MSSPYIFSSDGLEQQQQRQLIVTLAAQTGDQAHVAAAAALDDRTDVLVIFSEKTNSSEARQASINYFQGATGTTDTSTLKRVHQIYPDKPEDPIKLYNMLVDGENGWRRKTEWIAPLGEGQTEGNKLTRRKAELDQMKDKQDGATIKTKLQNILQYTTQKYYPTLHVSSATYIIAERMAAATTATARVAQYTLLAKRIGSDLDPKTILRNNDFKTIPFPNGQKPVLLLWSRYTGSNTPQGYNPEGDSDPLGQKQLLSMAETTLGIFDVITIGHDPASSLEKDWVHAKYHLGEFYLKNSIGSSRGRQLSFMLALMQKYPGKLFQMGQKSGGMDAGAMAGIPTLYIEDEGSGTKTRMGRWIGNVPFYKCALVTEPPTFLGRALRATSAALENLYPDKNMRPRVFGDKGRRWAQYLYVTDLDNLRGGRRVLVPDRKEDIDPVMPTNDPVKSTAIEADLVKKAKVIDSEIVRLRDSLQVDGWVVKGYSPGKLDFDLIQQELVNLVTAYNKKGVVIRNSNGDYVQRT